MKKQSIVDVQEKILETMKFVDYICRTYSIDYYIMGGTALGAVRHGGFIPWDDDLDIFMTPDNYEKFKNVFNELNNEKFIIQEWKIVDDYVEYAKVRMNGTTFIEEVYKNSKDMHHGIYVDIMILHKCPNNLLSKKLVYYASKYVTLVALSGRNWRPKNYKQKLVLKSLNFLPNKFFSELSYRLIYKHNSLRENFSYCYFITKANFKQGIFDKSMFQQPIDVPFENVMLKGPTELENYLELRYGNYMKLPSVEEQRAAVHAEIFNTEKGFENFIK